MTSLLDHLAELAEKATPGPYIGTEGCAVFADGYCLIADTFCSAGDGGQLFRAPWSQPQCQANAAFIATMDPQVALKLIAVAKAAIAWQEGRDRDIIGTAPPGGQRSETGRALFDAVDALMEGTQP